MDQSAQHRLTGYGVSESAVRIETSAGEICGAGVAVSPRHVATCAHVVLDALGLRRKQTERPQRPVSATVWRSRTACPLKLNITSTWLPVAAGDLVLLELVGEYDDLLPACMQNVSSDQWQQIVVEAYGFPQNFDLGKPVTLNCQMKIADGRVQCRLQAEQGLDPGHSGGPVFSQGNLVGLAQSRKCLGAAEYDYIIPVARLHDITEGIDLLRQPYFQFDRKIRDSADIAADIVELRKSRPHTIWEYRLQRYARAWDTHDVGLDFTPLRMDLDDKRQDAEFGEGAVSKTLDNLHQALEEPYQVFLLKGAPGSGKTTLLKRLAFDLALSKQSLALLPVFIELSGHRGDSNPDQWLTVRWQANFPEMPSLSEIERDHSIIWLLDGLNELPDETDHPRSSKIEAWRRWLARQIDRHHVIISCRSADYLEQLDTIEEQAVPHLTVQAMDISKIAEFLYNRSRLTAIQAEQAVQHITERQLEGLYNTPLMLTLLEAVLTPDGDFPDGRADLFVTYLLKLVLREASKQHALMDDLFTESERRNYASAVKPSKAGEDKTALRRRLINRENVLYDALSKQSYQRQKTEFRGERQEVSFEDLEIQDEIKKACGDQLGGQVYRAARALQLLIEGESEGNLRFRHQQFQEFFAARQLAKTQELDLVAAPWRPADFHQSLHEFRRQMKGWQQLPGVDRSGWEETALMTVALCESADEFVVPLGEVNLPLAGQCAVQMPVSVNSRSRLAKQLLARMRDERADLRARIAAGHALGDLEALEVLGYRAINDGKGKPIAWLPPLVEIAAGEYHFGSRNDPDAYDNESPFSQALPAFRLGQYPLTNAEWYYFIAAGGYQTSRWWCGEAAQAFFAGKGTNEGMAQSWIWWRQQREQGGLEEQLEQISLDPDLHDLVREKTALDEELWEAHLAEVRGQAEKVSEPGWWRSDRYHNPLQPVVGISLFEALAYCQWLSEVSGTAFTLPHELQWEAAARGPGGHPRRYAFGDELEADCCNIRDNACIVGAPTPIGLYQSGKTPGTDVYDMCGNVWEWITSRYLDKPPYDESSLQVLDGAESPRVVRGGGWDGIRRDARAACRDYDPPAFRLDSLGCRVCALPPLKSET